MPQNAPSGLPEFLVLGDEYASYCPLAAVSLATGLRMVENIIRFCIDAGVKRLLLDATGLTGFPPPTLADRYHGLDGWARIAAGKLKIAEVDRLDQLDPSETNVIIAENRGLQFRVFTDEATALEWLIRPKGNV